MRGVVRRYVVKRGFGFIQGEDGREYFAYWGNINAPNGQKLLVSNQIVEFEPKKPDRSEQKDIATNITVVGMDTNKISDEVLNGECI